MCTHGWEEASRFLLFFHRHPFFSFSLFLPPGWQNGWLLLYRHKQKRKKKKKNTPGEKKKKDSIGTHTRELGSSNLMHTHTWGWDIAASAHPCDFVSTVIQTAQGPPISLFQTVFSYLGEDSFSFFFFFYIYFLYLFIYFYLSLSWRPAGCRAKKHGAEST